MKKGCNCTRETEIDALFRAQVTLVIYGVSLFLDRNSCHIAFPEWSRNLSNLPADGRNTELSLQMRQNFPAEPKVGSPASCDLLPLLQEDKKALETCWDSREKHSVPLSHF